MSHPRFGVPTQKIGPRNSLAPVRDDGEMCAWCERKPADFDGFFCSEAHRDNERQGTL